MSARKTPLQILQCARDLISDPQKWTKGHAARDKDGEPTFTGSMKACSFCMLGAVEKCATHFREEGVAVSYLRLALPSRTGSISTYNDAPRRKHSQVLKAFDKAIKLAEKEYVS